MKKINPVHLTEKYTHVLKFHKAVPLNAIWQFHLQNNV